MSHRAKINSISKLTSQVDNQVYLDVEFDIVADDEVVETRRLGFPLGTSSENIEEDLKKYVETYFHDQELAEQSKEVEEANRVADETITTLEGKEIEV